MYFGYVALHPTTGALTEPDAAGEEAGERAGDADVSYYVTEQSGSAHLAHDYMNLVDDGSTARFFGSLTASSEAGFEAGKWYLVFITAKIDGIVTGSTFHFEVEAAPEVPSINVALAANGATATASSTSASGYAASGAINGDRKGLNWGTGGGWNDATENTFPDWLQVDFDGAQTIQEIDVFTLQDDYASPATPTPTMTFSLYGITDFEVQYWTGSAWANVTDGDVSDNDLVWRQFTFEPITTDKIRVLISGCLSGYSRIVEIEAHT